MDNPFGNNPRRRLTAGEAPVSPAATTHELIFFSVWSAGIVSPGMPMTILMIFWAARVVKIYGTAQLGPEPKITL